MPTTTTTTTTSTSGSATTTSTVTESRILTRGTHRMSCVVNAGVEKVLPMLGFDKILDKGCPLAAIITCEYSDGGNVGSIRSIKGIPGGPLDGKMLTETCICNKDGHTYAHNYDVAPYGTDGYPFDFEVENYQGTFAVDAVDAGTSIITYSSHYSSADVPGTQAMLNGFLEPVLAWVKATAEGTAEEGTPPEAKQPVDVKDKVAVVTGSSRGIGAATALHLAAAGIKVVLAARSMDALESVKAKIEAAGGAASVIKCDVTDPKQVAAVFEHATSTYGGVDFVYANAGYEGDTSIDIAAIPDEEIQKIININIMGYLYTLKYAVPAFRARGGGAIAFTSSVGAIVPRHMALADEAGGGMIKKIIPYGTTKAANDYIARLACAFTESDNIRSYGILPAAYETVMLQEIAKAQGAPDTSAFVGFNPFCGHETGDPAHIGKVVLAMFDNTTTYETGETVVCDGDKTAKAEVFYAQLNSIKPGGVSNYQYQPGPAVMRDSKGVPLPQ